MPAPPAPPVRYSRMVSVPLQTDRTEDRADIRDYGNIDTVLPPPP